MGLLSQARAAERVPVLRAALTGSAHDPDWACQSCESGKHGNTETRFTPYGPRIVCLCCREVL